MSDDVHLPDVPTDGERRAIRPGRPTWTGPGAGVAVSVRRRSRSRVAAAGVGAALLVTTMGVVAGAPPVSATSADSSAPFAHVGSVDVGAWDDFVHVLTMSPDGRTAWLEREPDTPHDDAPRDVVKVDLAWLRETGRWTPDTDDDPDTLEWATDIDVDPAGAYVYALVGQRTVVKLDADSLEQVDTIEMPGDTIEMAVSPDGELAYLIGDRGSIHRWDLVASAFTGPVGQLGTDPILHVAMSPSGDRLHVMQRRPHPEDAEQQRLYLVSVDSDDLTVSGEALVATDRIDVDQSLWASTDVVSRDGRRAYVNTVSTSPDEPRQIRTVDLTDHRVIETVTLPADWGAPSLAPDASHLVVATDDWTSLLRVAFPSLQVTDELPLPVGEAFHGLFFDPAGNYFYGMAERPGLRCCLEPDEEPTPTRILKVLARDHPDPDGVARRGGAHRYETAAAVALAVFDPARTHTVYLATGEDFPDALTAAPLAGGVAPVLLTRPDTLPEATRAALQELAPSRVVALGGPRALSEAVLTTAAATAGGAAIDRVAGADRFETAAAIADRLPRSTTVYLATGLAAPDALAAGPVTAGAPILLATPTALPDSTAQALSRLAPQHLVVLGGVAALSDDVLAAAATAAGGDPSTSRLHGADRYETAAAVAAALADAESAYVATGEDFPDALAGAAAALAERAPIVLATRHRLPDPSLDALAGMPNLRCVALLGGRTVQSVAVADQVATFASGC